MNLFTLKHLPEVGMSGFAHLSEVNFTGLKKELMNL